MLAIASKNKNLFGPIFYFAFVLQGNRLLFFIVNSLILVHAFGCLYRVIGKNRNATIVIVFIMLNPILLFSLSGPNKEITGIISMIYFLCYLGRSSFWFFCLALTFATLTRFEMLGYLVITSLLLKVRFRWRLYLLLGMVIGLSLLYLYSGYSHVEKVIDGARVESLDFVKTLAILSGKGLYFVAFLPRLLINLFGELVIVYSKKLAGNSVSILVSQALFLFLAIHVLKNGAYRISSDISFSFIVYCMVFCIPAFIQHRYFVPVYPLLVTMALAPDAIGCVNKHFRDKSKNLLPLQDSVRSFSA